MVGNVAAGVDDSSHQAVQSAGGDCIELRINAGDESGSKSGKNCGAHVVE